MEKMIGLKDLLKHEVLDLYSAEEQIIEALPAMIDKAKDTNLKKALQEHLKITEEQKRRLDKLQQLMSNNEKEVESQESGEEKKGFFSRLFKGNNGKEKCKGMQGLIDEGQKIMAEDISPEALDAAIIASAQKIEHYEISGYGTARTYAGELKLDEVQKLLQETLNEEYEADNGLTELALTRVNLKAGKADMRETEDKAGDKRTTTQSEKGGASPKKSEPKEQKPTPEKKSSSNKTDTSKKENSRANATKSSSSKRKSDNKPGGQKNKKSAAKGAQSKSKKASTKSKSSR